MLLKNLVQPAVAPALALALGLSGHALLAVVVCAAPPTAQNVFGYAERLGQGITLGRDAGLATTLVSAPVLFTVVALLDRDRPRRAYLGDDTSALPGVPRDRKDVR